jgi:hypothetical protein
MLPPMRSLLLGLAALSPLLQAQSLLVVHRATHEAVLVDLLGAGERPVAGLPAAGPAGGFAADGALVHYLQCGSGSVTGRIWSIPGAGAAPVLAADTGLPNSFDALARAPATGDFYATQVLLGIFTIVYRVPPGGPALAISPTPNPLGLWLDALGSTPDGTLWAARRGAVPALGTLDPQTGVFTAVHTTARQFASLAFFPGTTTFLGLDAATGMLVDFDVATGFETPRFPLAFGAPYYLVELAMLPSGGVLASAAAMGTGCGGSGAPILLAPLPVLGDAGFHLLVGNALPGAQISIFLADFGAALSAPLGGGCFLHLDPLSFTAYVQAGLSPLGGLVADSSGSALLPIALPLLPFAAGWRVAVQAAAVPGLSAAGFDVSGALDLVLGF